MVAYRLGTGLKSRLVLLNQHTVDKLYLEALHMKQWHQGFTTLDFQQWSEFNEILDIMEDKKLSLEYPKTWTYLKTRVETKALFYRHHWEQDFLKEALGFEAWFVIKGEDIPYTRADREWVLNTPLKPRPELLNYHLDPGLFYILHFT